MARNYPDWLSAFMDYASIGEAPKRMYFWTGVSALAGALRRKVWIDLVHFQWTPNFYIIFVAKPGVVSKTTTVSIGMNLLRQVPGIKFGADIITAQALSVDFTEAAETFDHNGSFYPMSALTFESGEFGNLLDPEDKAMVNLLISLWDGKQGVFKKRTKTSGDDAFENPWINLIACTTPSWITQNFPEHMIGGGFVSRCIFIFADKKERKIAYPDEHIRSDFGEMRAKLIEDLTQISLLAGPIVISEAARSWGRDWYDSLWSKRPAHLEDDRFGSYLARKQTHIHKLAMILSVSRGDSRTILRDDLELANTIVSDLEAEMPMVFSRIGRSDQSMHTERFLDFVKRKRECTYEEAYRYIHINFPGSQGFEDILTGAIRAGYLKLVPRNNTHILVALPALLGE